MISASDRTSASIQSFLCFPKLLYKIPIRGIIALSKYRFSSDGDMVNGELSAQVIRAAICVFIKGTGPPPTAAAPD